MTHITYSVTIFLVTTILFHILLFTVWKNKGIKFWKKTDYVWLFLSSVALVGVAERYHHAEVSRLVQLANYDLQNEYESHQTWIFNLMSYKLEKSILEMNKFPYHEKYVRKSVLEPIMERYSYSNLQLLLNTSRPYEDYQTVIESEIKKIETSGHVLVANEASRLLTKGIEVERRVAKLTDSNKQSKWRLFIASIAPFLLAPALALRITKVTFEVKTA